MRRTILKCCEREKRQAKRSVVGFGGIAWVLIFGILSAVWLQARLAALYLHSILPKTYGLIATALRPINPVRALVVTL